VTALGPVLGTRRRLLLVLDTNRIDTEQNPSRSAPGRLVAAGVKDDFSARHDDESVEDGSVEEVVGD
jgi:hypothetical protein